MAHDIKISTNINTFKLMFKDSLFIVNTSQDMIVTVVTWFCFIIFMFHLKAGKHELCYFDNIRLAN